MKPVQPDDSKPQLRPHLPVEVAIYAAACLVEDCEVIKKRAEQVMAALQAIRRETNKTKP